MRYIGGPRDGQEVSTDYGQPLFDTIYVPDRKGAGERTQTRVPGGKWKTISLGDVPAIMYRKETHYHYVREG